MSVRERELQGLSISPSPSLYERFVRALDVDYAYWRKEILGERKSCQERLRQHGFDPDYLFGKGMSFRHLCEVRGVGRFGRQEGIEIPSAKKDGTNWFDALSAAIESRGRNDHSLDAVLEAFGILDVKCFSDGRLKGASLGFRRGGYERIFDLLDPPQVEILLWMDSDATGIADLAALAFVPDRFWRGLVFRKQGFVVARPEATRPQIGVRHSFIGYDKGNAIIYPVEARRAENLCVENGKPLFTVSILPPND